MQDIQKFGDDETPDTGVQESSVGRGGPSEEQPFLEAEIVEEEESRGRAIFENNFNGPVGEVKIIRVDRIENLRLDLGCFPGVGGGPQQVRRLPLMVPIA